MTFCSDARRHFYLKSRPGQSPGIGKAETEGRKQPNCAGGTLLEAYLAELLAFFRCDNRLQLENITYGHNKKNQTFARKEPWGKTTFTNSR